MRETMQYKELNDYLSKYFNLKNRVNTVLELFSEEWGFYYRLRNTNERHDNIYYLVEVEMVEMSVPIEFFCKDDDLKGYYKFDNNIHTTFIRPGDTEHYCIKKADCTYVEYVEPLTLPFDDNQLKNVDIWDQVEDILEDEKTVPDNSEDITNFRLQSCLRNMQALASLSNQYTPKQMARLAVQMADELVSKVYGKQ